MILDDLAAQALDCAKKNSLKLIEVKVDTTFTFVIISNGKSSQIGVTLTPHDEGKIEFKNFISIKEILENKDFNITNRAIKLATINAIGQFELSIENIELKANLRVALYETIYKESLEKDKIVFIGNLKPVVKKLKEKRENIQVFCRSANDEKDGVFNDIFEYEAVKNADIVIITGAALIGSTIDALLKFTCHAKTVILAGFSVGINPKWLKNYKITHVASTYLKDCRKKDILNISLEEIFNNSCYCVKL